MKKIFTLLLISAFFTLQVEAFSSINTMEMSKSETGLFISSVTTTAPTMAPLLTTKKLPDHIAKNVKEREKAKRNRKIKLFITESYDNLETEIATGQGKYIETLSKLSGQSVSSIRKSFKYIVAHKKKYIKMTKLQKVNALYSATAL